MMYERDFSSQTFEFSNDEKQGTTSKPQGNFQTKIERDAFTTYQAPLSLSVPRAMSSSILELVT